MENCVYLIGIYLKESREELRMRENINPLSRSACFVDDKKT